MKAFCGCCHLRTSAIFLAWLDVMGCVLIITALAIPLDILPKISVSYSYEWNYYYSYNYNMRAYEILQPIFALIIAELLIKSVTCFLVIWGVVQRKHLFLQPWIVVKCFENVMLCLGIIAILVTGGVITPVIYIILIPAVLVTALNWYTWFAIKAVYNQDFIKSHIYWGEEYTEPLMRINVQEMSKSSNRNQRDNYPKNYRHY